MALGDHILTGEDTLTARKFDIHDLNGKGTVLRHPAGQPPSGRSERWSPGHLAVIP